MLKDTVVFVHFGSLGWKVRVRGGGGEKEGWRKRKEGRRKKSIGLVLNTDGPQPAQAGGKSSPVFGVLFRCCWCCAVWLSVLCHFKRRDTSAVPAFLKARFTECIFSFLRTIPVIVLYIQHETCSVKSLATRQGKGLLPPAEVVLTSGSAAG